MTVAIVFVRSDFIIVFAIQIVVVVGCCGVVVVVVDVVVVASVV